MDPKAFQSPYAARLQIDPAYAFSIWDAIAGPSFAPAEVRKVNVQDNDFLVLLGPCRGSSVHEVYLKTGLSFALKPRVFAYRHRFVLVPFEESDAPSAWQITPQNIADYVRWANAAKQVVMFSTHKSGSAHPEVAHAQAIPATGENGVSYSALAAARSEVLVDFNTMPQFYDIQISRLARYPVHGLSIKGKDSESALAQAAGKAFELALNHDALKAFNLVILPGRGLEAKIFFFPRRIDGKATYGRLRWQIAAVEINGLMQAKIDDDFQHIGSGDIQAILGETTLAAGEFERFLTLLESF